MKLDDSGIVGSMITVRSISNSFAELMVESRLVIRTGIAGLAGPVPVPGKV